MTDRPILFSAPMVRALLDGRKTQTRRVLKPSRGAQADWLTMDVLHQAPSCYLAEVDGRLGVQMQHPRAGQCIDGIDIDPMSPLTWVRLPYAPGDRLWVREAWAKVGDEQDDIHACPDMRIPAYYRADMVDPERQRWRPSIHMPRWASRLTLTVTDVRVQRLQDITLGDICAEGLWESNSGRCKHRNACVDTPLAPTWVNIFNVTSNHICKQTVWFFIFGPVLG